MAYIEKERGLPELIQGTTPGSRTRGRPKMKRIDNVKSWTGLSLIELVRETDINGERLFMVRPTLIARTAKGTAGRQAGRQAISWPQYYAFGRALCQNLLVTGATPRPRRGAYSAPQIYPHSRSNGPYNSSTLRDSGIDLSGVRYFAPGDLPYDLVT